MSITYIGDGEGGSGTAHTYANATNPGPNGLPATFAAGTYLIGVVGYNTGTHNSVTVDGVAATQKGTTQTSFLLSHSFWEVTISGNTTNTIVVVIGSSSTRLACSMSLLGAGYTYKTSVYSSVNANPQTNILDTDIASGDVSAVAMSMVNSATLTPTNLTDETGAFVLFSSRHAAFLTGDALPAGTPATIRITGSVNFNSASALMAVYEAGGTAVNLDAVSYTTTLPAMGVAVNTPVSLDAISYTATLPSLGVSVGVVDIPISLDAVSYTQTIPSITIAVDAPVSLDAVSYTATLPAMGVAVDAPVALEAISYTTILPTVSIAVNVPVSLEAITYTTTLPSLGVSVGVDTPINLDTVAYTATLPSLGVAIDTQVSLGAISYTITLPDVSVAVGVDTPINLDAISYSLAVPSLSAVVNTPISLEAISYTLSLPQLSALIDSPVLLDAISYSVTLPGVTINVGGQSSRRWAYPVDSANGGLVAQPSNSGTVSTPFNSGTVSRG